MALKPAKMLNISKEEREYLKKNNHWNFWDRFFCQRISLLYFVFVGIAMAFLTWLELEYKIISAIL